MKDHVKQAWEKVKVDLSSGDDEVHDDGDQNIEVTEEEGEKNVDVNDFDMERLQAEKNEYGVKDEIDEFLDQEKNEAEKMSEEEQEGDDDEEEEGEINIKKFKMCKMQDAVSYPRWMERAAFGSKTLLASPCMIGDAQPDLIKILLLQIGTNLNFMIKHVQMNFCGKIEVLWKHFQRNSKFRIDLDPKVPFLGVDHEGNLIEPSDEQMRELYREV